MTIGRVLQVHARYRLRGGEDAAVETEQRLLEGAGISVDPWIVDNEAFAKDTSMLGLATRTVWNSGARRALVEHLDSRPTYDVVHVHNTFPSISPSIFGALSRLGLPIVQTLHNFRTTCLNGMLLRDGRGCTSCVGSRVPFAGVIHRCYRNDVAASSVVAGLTASTRAFGWLSRHVDAFIALSEFSREIFVAAGIPQDRIHVRPNGLDHDPGVGAHDTDEFLFVGRIAPEKGVTTLVDAWERLERVDGTAPRLVVVGDGPLRHELASRAPASVQWLGQQSSADVMRRMARARALILPSLAYENCPMTLVEAASVALPSIVTGHGGMKEMVQDGATGWHIPPGDAAALAATVRAVAEHPASAGAFGRAARERFDALWSQETGLRRLLEIYASARATGSSTSVQKATAP